MLTIEEQIKKLEEKGIKFNIDDKESAKEYLSKNNYYFKIKSYKNNYIKHEKGENKGKYINLEFAYLKDLAIIDYKLRKILISMCLNIEHYFKFKLLNKLGQNKEDDYEIVNKFIDSLNEEDKENFYRELKRADKTEYTSKLYNKYKLNIPIYVLLEIIPFGKFINFYMFYANYIKDKKMKNEFYLLSDCKKLRNAIAHNNCLLNDFKKKLKTKADNKLIFEMYKITEKSKKSIMKKLNSKRIREIITVLYVNKEYVSNKIVEDNKKELKEFIYRINKNKEFYTHNALIKSNFELLEKIIKNWY